MTFIEDYTAIKNFYPSNIKGDVTELGWGSELSQVKRFNIIQKVISEYSKSQFSILDVGCGYGGLRPFLDTKDYLGIDIREAAIKIAKNNYPDSDFRVDYIDNIDQTFDFVVASGIFCHNTENWFEYTKRTIAKMREIGDIIIVNFLYGNKTTNPAMRYVDDITIDSLVGNCKKITGYMSNDITVIIDTNKVCRA